MTLSADTRLLLGIAIGQAIGWGTLFAVFPLFGAPMEAELGWSRTEINAGLTLAILVSGLAAVPVGQHVDRHGGRRMLAWGGFLGAALLALWSVAESRALYWTLWAGMGLAQAAALWGPAMAVVVTAARDPNRTITGITFITGFTGTVFVPLGAALIAALGWRQALLALAALQLLPGLLALWLLPQPPPRLPGAARASASLRDAVRRPAFLGLAACFAAHAFIGVGLGAHAIPLLRERGLPEASVLLIVALHGPFQVAARFALFALGRRVTMRGVGRLATALTPVGMLVLALAPPHLAWLVFYALCWAVADGLMTIIRAAGTAEILGREGYGAITGALSVATVLPRTAAPVLIALIWESTGSYGPVPWLLVGLGCLAVAAFAAAARARQGRAR
ncbi:MFS transporter [Paracraurococcus lichenis]|uniref:MFS transporter n=1 Tax=Paracraurococcus lichenis TaxID=3064888 RepID=A0ABT9E0D7_9PROT|nr:MFS transporter [Paracraurococcus sp. LOR1-02]MDO9709629.1 MFS transporter [Paracraurococcus sp. LOR1-02]